MEQSLEWFAPQREVLLELLSKKGLSEREPHKVLEFVSPTWFLTAKAYPFFRFVLERLDMAGNLEAYLCDASTPDDPKVEFVWRYTPDGSAEDIEVARWLFVRGCTLDPGDLERGKLLSTHFRLKSHNPKNVFEDLGEPVTFDLRIRDLYHRGHNRSEYCAYDITWRFGQVTVFLRVPIEHVFRAGGIEGIEISRMDTSVPYDPLTMEEARRGSIQYLPRAPWDTIRKLDTELLRFDVYRYNNSSEEWEYSPAHLDARAAALPEAWQQRLCVIARDHLRTRIELRAEFLEAFVRSYRERLALDHWLARSREAIMLPPKDFRRQLNRWRKAAFRWDEIVKLFLRMRTSKISGLDTPLDPRIYGDFDSFAETPQARERLARAKLAFATFEREANDLKGNIGAILARQDESEALRERVYRERHERAELRAHLKQQGKWSSRD